MPIVNARTWEPRRSAPREQPVKKIFPRPENLLNTVQSNPRTEAIEQANATNSALLRLPPEIRNRIYEHAFGGLLLHVNYKNSERLGSARPRLSICSAEEHELEAVQKIRDSVTCDESHSFEIRHASCRYYTGDGQDFWEILELLRTCRQVHREAALLPFKLNTFHFYNGIADVGMFTYALIPAQRRAIRSIGFFFFAYQLNTFIHYPDLSNLSGVQHLSIFAELEHNIDKDDMLRCKNGHERPDLGFPGLLRFFRAGFELQSASVTMFSVSYPDRKTVRDLKDWGVGVEKKLLAGDQSNRRVTRTRPVNGDGLVETKKRSASHGSGNRFTRNVRRR